MDLRAPPGLFVTRRRNVGFASGNARLTSDRDEKGLAK